MSAHRSRRVTRRGRLVMTMAAILGIGVVLFFAARAVGLVDEGADYPGPGDGQVLFEVRAGASIGQMGTNLEQQGIVKSADTFRRAASRDDGAKHIQAGYYTLKQHMRAKDVLAILTDPKNITQRSVIVREGARVTEIINEISAKTGFTKQAVKDALANPAALGLPPEGGGDIEGWLFPATYSITSDTTLPQLLTQMVTKASTQFAQLNLTAAAAQRGMTVRQLITVASIVEHEAKRPEDYGKVAQAIYNRLQAGMPLQADSTVKYAVGPNGHVTTTDSERANPSPYNTYVHPGLPPGPIGSPGLATLQAAINPTPGPWLYWVTINLQTGETVFSTTLEEHDAAVAKFQAYCATAKGC